VLHHFNGVSEALLLATLGAVNIRQGEKLTLPNDVKSFTIYGYKTVISPTTRGVIFDKLHIQ